MHHSPAQTIFGGRRSALPGPSFGCEHGARHPVRWDLELSTGGTPSTGRPILRPCARARGCRHRSAASGGVRGDDADNRAPRVSAMSSCQASLRVRDTEYGSRTVGLMSHPSSREGVHGSWCQIELDLAMIRPAPDWHDAIVESNCPELPELPVIAVNQSWVDRVAMSGRLAAGPQMAGSASGSIACCRVSGST